MSIAGAFVLILASSKRERVGSDPTPKTPSGSDGQVEPESVVELAHEIRRHVADEVAHPFDSDRSHLFGLCFGIAVYPRLGIVQQNLERVNPFRVRRYRNDCDYSTSKPCRNRIGAIIADYHSRPDPGCLNTDNVTEIHDADVSATHQLLNPSAIVASHTSLWPSSVHSSNAAA